MPGVSLPDNYLQQNRKFHTHVLFVHESWTWEVDTRGWWGQSWGRGQRLIPGEGDRPGGGGGPGRIFVCGCAHTGSETVPVLMQFLGKIPPFCCNTPFLLHLSLKRGGLSYISSENRGSFLYLLTSKKGVYLGEPTRTPFQWECPPPPGVNPGVFPLLGHLIPGIAVLNCTAKLYTEL